MALSPFARFGVVHEFANGKQILQRIPGAGAPRAVTFALDTATEIDATLVASLTVVTINSEDAQDTTPVARVDFSGETPVMNWMD
jgi:hypothetical protein